MEDTRNGRQTPMSAPAGGSGNDCPVRGERLMHLATSPVFSAALLYHCGDSWSGVETAGVLSAPDRRRIWLYHQKSEEGKPFQVASLSWDFQKCVILFISVSKYSSNLLGLSVPYHLALSVRVPLRPPFNFLPIVITVFNTLT